MKMLSDYGAQLKEKQKLKFLYGLREKPFANYVKKALAKGGSSIDLQIISSLEMRLDNIVFRLGLAKSRSGARQIVGHGHILVNNRKVTIPSYQAKKGDKISIRSGSISKKVFAETDIYLKKYSPPIWLKLDKSKKEGEIATNLTKKDIEPGVNLNAIIGFYSR